MTHARIAGGEGDSARFPYGRPGEPAVFPQGRPPGALYRPHLPVGPAGRSPTSFEERPGRHPWENPLLVACLTILAGAVAPLVHSLWTSGALHRVTLGAAALLLAGWVARGVRDAGRRARGVKVSPTQFPKAHRMVRELAVDMGLNRVPDAYVVAGAAPGACARGAGGGRWVVVPGDLFEVGGRLRDPDALRFLLAHELGHFAAGHAAPWRRAAAAGALAVPLLGTALWRAMEYTADDHACAHCPEGSHGIRILAGGKYLYPMVNLGEMAGRARTERGVFPLLHNMLSRRPPLVRRMAAVRDRSRPGRLFR
ncbi:M48 family metallopeptidase [Marinactinospora thermotolerans]|uniref:Zn-dependent protease with chaperone function n=1 Tax=Marinactinospora thermotolerans DSM 45154 TaxID=1122192 RepID=A0A1T4N4Y6_9ACTN|nr:M48 family metallopeptidase [Marinactinospora thermotolerans]SJZ74186.1 Zn-dependent protease with chaperone function [Marinactinospora thermotolerans DSM 45154]